MATLFMRAKYGKLMDRGIPQKGVSGAGYAPSRKGGSGGYHVRGKQSAHPARFDQDRVPGGPWEAVYNPAWTRGHRRVVYTVDGHAHIPGRYAIDFIKVDSQGRFFQGDSDVVRNWYGYGARVLAVSDGVVASTRDSFPESPTVSGHRPCPADQGAGNYISIDIGGRFVFYEHLRPGSITVRPGQRVRKGEVIGALGFTGQTVGPHLHLHVADRNSPLGAEGLPFAFERFDQAGTAVRGEHPAPGAVIAF